MQPLGGGPARRPRPSPPACATFGCGPDSSPGPARWRRRARSCCGHRKRCRADRRPAADGERRGARATRWRISRRQDVLLADGARRRSAPAAPSSSSPTPGSRHRRPPICRELLEPPDGLLAGLIAAGALARGTFRSVAGTLLPARHRHRAGGLVGPRLRPSTGPPSPSGSAWSRLSPTAGRCSPTSRPRPPRRGAPVASSRMLASLVRAARATGEAELFEANGPALWTRVRRASRGLLTAYWQEGGLGGASPDEAFEVRCDRSTMTQNDLDAGRIVARSACCRRRRSSASPSCSHFGERTNRRRRARGGVMAEPQTPICRKPARAAAHVFNFQVSFKRAQPSAARRPSPPATCRSAAAPSPSAPASRPRWSRRSSRPAARTTGRRSASAR